MKHIKPFEELNVGYPEVGDYVIVNTDDQYFIDEVADFFNNNIGTIIEFPCTIKFTSKIPNLNKKTINFSQGGLKYWSKNKEDLEAIIAAKKYNL